MTALFNYIAYGNRDLLEGPVNEVDMTRGRMFEYTPKDIAQGLEGVDAEALNFIQDLPTFLCSEIRRTETGADMLIRYGRISNAVRTLRVVKADFETLIDFGLVQFGGLEEAIQVFGADEFQLYRTHWAVRRGNLAEILDHLAELRPDKVPAVAALQGGAENIPEPPPQKKNVIGEAESVEQFLGVLQGILQSDEVETFFRGHESANYELSPSLLRRDEEGNWLFMLKEDRLCKELLIAHYDDFQGDQYCFDRLVRMQHYGLPTRLLDISSNPLVALYFASQRVLDKNGNELDGEVIIVSVPSDHVKYYDSDTVSCISNLSNLTYDQKNEIDLSLDLKEFNESAPTKKLLHHIKSEKGFFEGRIDPTHLESVICVKAKQTNNRIKSQSGAFLLFGHEAFLPETGQDGIEISRIVIKNKAHILEQLNAININTMSVYPSIDQTTKHLRERHKFVAAIAANPEAQD